MSNLDGTLIDEATAGINAPANGDQNAVVRVDNAVAPDPPNLRYQAVPAFVQEMVGPFVAAQRAMAASPEGSVVLTFDVHNVDIQLIEGNLHEAILTGVAGNGSGSVEFVEIRRVIVVYPTGCSPSVIDDALIYSNVASDWLFSGTISGANLRAVLDNGTLQNRPCDVTIGIAWSRPIPVFV